MKIVIGIQARSKSTRLPGKSLMKLYGIPIWHHVYLTALSTGLESYMLIPYGSEDIAMMQSIRAWDAQYIRGPMNSPLERFRTLQKRTGADYVIRLTADCPFVNMFIIMDMVSQVEKSGIPYLQNELDGMDVQIIHESILMRSIYTSAEHVVDIKAMKKRGIYQAYEMHLSIDTAEQYEHVKSLMESVVV
jgi:spore coat polysaccharide biosynthesis protein SpsF (cytidylyltransferase family)